MKKLLLMTGVLSGISIGSAHNLETITLTPYVNYMTYDEELKIKDDQGYGLGIGFRFSESMAVELHYNFNDAKVDKSEDDFQIELFGLDSVYYLNQKKTRPLVRLGLAHHKLNPDLGGAESEDTLLKVGFGLAHTLNERFELTAEFQAQYAIDEAHAHYGMIVGFNYLFSIHDHDARRNKRPTSAIRTGIPSSASGHTGQESQIKKKSHFDSDGDGVPNHLDACNQEVKEGQQVDKYGCIIQ